MVQLNIIGWHNLRENAIDEMGDGGSLMFGFIEYFFKVLGIGICGMIGLFLLAGILSTTSDQQVATNPTVDDSPTSQATNERAAEEARFAESIYESISKNQQAQEASVSTDVEYEGADGHVITFSHNSSAINPTYDQVIAFLKLDTTDQTPYDFKRFTCGDYAEQVQHHAEAAGYQCGWVFIELDNSNHACDVFNTTDKGLVFVDCTTFDSIVDVKEGAEYHPIPLSKLLGYNSGVSADPIGTVKSYHIEW